VAPETKTVTYNTIRTSITGDSKCWITQNLGASFPASRADDPTETSAGWYWQFNRKQGYKHDGTDRTPKTAWLDNTSNVTEWESANDPCQQLGTGWRIPTILEWIAATKLGEKWMTGAEAYNSVLKLHSSGYLSSEHKGDLQGRGYYGYFWSSSTVTDRDYLAWMITLGFGPTQWYRSYGNSLRCIKD
jgi:hypothetical protein